MTEERRAASRGRLDAYWNPIYTALRASAAKADTLAGALGIFLLAGLLVAVIGTGIFVEMTSHVRSGSTQAFDDSVIRWMGAHHSPGLDAIMLAVTALGTGAVVMMIVVVASLFLVLTQHKYSAMLLLASTFGGIVLNGVLKLGFNRPRPSVLLLEVHTVSSSFPSGHAMNAAIVYSTVAYLAARLQTKVGEMAGDDRRPRPHRAHFAQPPLPRRPLSIRRCRWRVDWAGLGGVLHGDAGGYSEVRASP